MSLEVDVRPPESAAESIPEPAPATTPDIDSPGFESPGSEAEVEHPVPVLTTIAASALASAAAAWLVAGAFKGFLPEAVALTGVILGAGLVWLSYRTRREFIQY